ncbi:MAG: hypothetical protein IKD46_10825, partial [Lentisphaeria bacterium]|nr:hypothetical protein [Lentisphaeria bacterium]
ACFENEEVQKGNTKTCLYSGKVECLHGNTGGFKAHDLQGSGGSGAKRPCPIRWNNRFSAEKLPRHLVFLTGDAILPWK